MIFLSKVSLSDKRANKLYFMSLQIDRHLWDKNYLLSLGSLNKNCKYCWYHSRKQKEERILLIVFGEILEIISDDIIINIIIIQNSNSHDRIIFNWYIFFLEKSFYTFDEKNVKFSLIKKLLAPCRGLKKAEFWGTL